MSQEVYQCVSCAFRIFFEHSTPGIFDDNNRGVRSDFDLLSKDFSICLLAANRQRRNRQFI